jgi:DNA modification methylase
MKDNELNKLYYSDNLEIMRKYIGDESVDLCYIDPPFNSDEDYNLIYKVSAKETAQSKAFTDMWFWDDAVQLRGEVVMKIIPFKLDVTIPIEILNNVCNMTIVVASMLAIIFILQR